MPGEPTDLYVQIGEAICRQRKALKRSQRLLAEAVGLSRASIVNIERGRHRIQIHVLYEIAAALGVDAHTLLPTVDPSAFAATLPTGFKDELNSNEIAAISRMVNISRSTTDAKP